MAPFLLHDKTVSLVNPCLDEILLDLDFLLPAAEGRTWNIGKTLFPIYEPKVEIS